MENGFNLPTEGTIRVLIVFAEVDCAACPNDCFNDNNPNWMPGNLPTDVESYIDHDLPAGQLPQNYITKYYYEASFGKLVVLGDYYNETIVIPCTTLNNNGDLRGRDLVLTELENKIDLDPNFDTSANGYHLEDFDLISDEGEHGLLKDIDNSNGIIDAVAIIWRNNIHNGTGDSPCGSGAAFQEWNNNLVIFEDGEDYEFNIVAAYNDCDGTGNVFLAEYFHTLYGGNHWHTGTGPGSRHTFPFKVGNISITGQSGAASVGVCGWDRWMLEWASDYDDPNNTMLIAALNESGTLASTDLQTPVANEQIFILRDHYTTGDAIRIKLPHIDWGTTGDVKNQYLWIENRQLQSEFDVQQIVNPGPCLNNWEAWSSGIYASIQVGKDVRESMSFENLYSSTDPARPNALASNLFPLSGEGHFDFHYRDDLAALDNQGNWCVSGAYIPKETDSPNTLPNPFTGASDLYPTKYDENGDGEIGQPNNPDINYDIGNAEYVNGEVEINLNYKGDSEDAFALNGNAKIGIGTNPASTPVYTRRSGPNGGAWNGDALGSYENRTIWLNGVSIEIIEEIPNPVIGGNDLKVKVRWDDYLVDQDQRWCGTIVLQDDPNDSWQAQVIIGDGKKITLDQGRSPTDYSGILQPDGSYIFAEPTEMTIRTGSKLHMLDNSNLTIKNGSKLIIEEGAEVLLENGACIVVEETGTLELKGNTIHLNGKDALISVRGTLKTHDHVDFTFTGNGYADFYENHMLDMGAGSNFILDRDPADYGTRFLLLHENTDLSINDRALELKNGRAEYKDDSRISSNNSDVALRNTEFQAIEAGTGNPPTAFDGTDLLSFEAKYSEFEDFDKAIVLTGNTTVPNVEGNAFTHNDEGLIALDMDNIQVDNNYFSEQALNSIRLENVDVANLDENSMIHLAQTGNGCKFKNVNFAFLSFANYIQYCDKGILAEASNVLLGNGSTISDCHTGVNFVNNTTADYLLSVGRCKCANIINNTVGVEGDNIVLDIDAPTNQQECNTTALYPNRFDGNGTIFNICYTDSSFPTGNAILMRNNYWGGQSVQHYTFHIKDAAATSGCITNGNIGVDDSGFISDLSTVSNDCGIIELGAYPSTPQYPPYVEDTVRCEVTENGVIVEVHEQSKAAYEDLYKEDFTNAKVKYSPVANLDRSNNPEDDCVAKINVARCIVDGIDNDQFASPSSEWLESALRLKPVADAEIAIYPNPAGERFTVESEKDKVYHLTIYNVLGEALDAVKFARQKTIGIRHLQKSVYILEFSDVQGKQVQTGKLIVD